MTRYLFLDTETTGLDSYENDVIEIAAVMFEDSDDKPVEVGRFVGTMSAAKGTTVDIEALQVNHRLLMNDVDIDDAFMRNNVLKSFAEWLATYVTKETIIIGHNISFDLEFLLEIFDRIDIDLSRILKRPVIDTKQLALFFKDANVLELNNTRLVTLNNALFGVNVQENAHEALADAFDTAQCYFKMREMV